MQQQCMGTAYQAAKARQPMASKDLQTTSQPNDKISLSLSTAQVSASTERLPIQSATFQAMKRASHSVRTLEDHGVATLVQVQKDAFKQGSIGQIADTLDASTLIQDERSHRHRVQAYVEDEGPSLAREIESGSTKPASDNSTGHFDDVDDLELTQSSNKWVFFSSKTDVPSRPGTPENEQRPRDNNDTPAQCYIDPQSDSTSFSEFSVGKQQLSEQVSSPSQTSDSMYQSSHARGNVSLWNRPGSSEGVSSTRKNDSDEEPRPTTPASSSTESLDSEFSSADSTIAHKIRGPNREKIQPRTQGPVTIVMSSGGPLSVRTAATRYLTLFYDPHILLTYLLVSPANTVQPDTMKISARLFFCVVIEFAIVA